MAITDNTGNVSFEGCVLRVYNGDYRAMSDVYTWATFAVVWDMDKMMPREVLVNANFELDTTGRRATVDASEFVLDWYSKYQEAYAQKLHEENMLRLAKAEENERLRPRKGRVVEVFKGRKVPVGTTGYVFWEGADNYGNLKLGIATSPKKAVQPGKKYASFVDVVWVAAANCRAVPNQNEATAPFLG